MYTKQILWCCYDVVFCYDCYIVSHCVQDGRTALFMSSFEGHSDVVKQLVERGANLEVPNKVCVVSAALTYSGISLNRLTR